MDGNVEYEIEPTVFEKHTVHPERYVKETCEKVDPKLRIAQG